MRGGDGGIRRRELLLDTGRAFVLAPLAGALFAAGCGGSESERDDTGAAAPAAPPAPAPAARPAPAPAPAAPAAQPAPPPAAGGEAALVTEIPAMQPTVTALQYVNVSPKPDQRCANCLFYTAPDQPRAKCQLFPQGVVAAPGWCSSWQARPA